jgi:hypothetical protein
LLTHVASFAVPSGVLEQRLFDRPLPRVTSSAWGTIGRAAESCLGRRSRVACSETGKATPFQKGMAKNILAKRTV